MEFLEINEYFKKYPSEISILEEIYKNTGNNDNNLLGKNLFIGFKRFVLTNKKAYIICTKDINLNYYLINSIYTKKEFRKK